MRLITLPDEALGNPRRATQHKITTLHLYIHISFIPYLCCGCLKMSGSGEAPGHRSSERQKEDSHKLQGLKKLANLLNASVLLLNIEVGVLRSSE